MNKKTKKELLAVVKNNYEEIAKEFDQTREKKLWPELLSLFKNAKDGDSVLDVGCGNGRLLKVFEKKKIKYLGIDQSQELIKKAKEKYPKHEFAYGDILNLGGLADHDFDYVACLAVLHHIPGENLRIQALGQLKNKIKKDGKIIISVWNLWEQKKFRKLIFKSLILKLLGKHQMDFGDILFDWKAGPKSKRYYHAFTKRELKCIIRKSGLNIEKLYKDRYNYYAILTK